MLFIGANYLLMPQQTRTTGILLITGFFHFAVTIAGKLHSRLHSSISRILFAIPLFFQVTSTFLFISKSLDRLQPVLLFGEIREWLNCVLSDPSSVRQDDPVFCWRIWSIGHCWLCYYSHGNISWYNLGRLGTYDSRMGFNDHPR